MRSQTWTPLPPPSPQHLSGSSPCTSPKRAAPYVRHWLAIQFLHDSIHVRMSYWLYPIPPHPLSSWLLNVLLQLSVPCLQQRALKDDMTGHFSKPFLTRVWVSSTRLPSKRLKEVMFKLTWSDKGKQHKMYLIFIKEKDIPFTSITFIISSFKEYNSWSSSKEYNFWHVDNIDT